jgi:hypothetical protein
LRMHPRASHCHQRKAHPAPHSPHHPHSISIASYFRCFTSAASLSTATYLADELAILCL